MNPRDLFLQALARWVVENFETNDTLPAHLNDAAKALLRAHPDGRD